eukprot:9934482-Prorocentrum_lima.AAC.1
MTSSLVGSEMCIRDRELYCPPCLAHWHVHCPHELNNGVQLVFTINKRAVSYTHLTLPTICSV